MRWDPGDAFIGKPTVTSVTMFVPYHTAMYEYQGTPTGTESVEESEEGASFDCGSDNAVPLSVTTIGCRDSQMDRMTCLPASADRSHRIQEVATGYNPVAPKVAGSAFRNQRAASSAPGAKFRSPFPIAAIALTASSLGRHRRSSGGPRTETDAAQHQNCLHPLGLFGRGRAPTGLGATAGGTTRPARPIRGGRVIPRRCRIHRLSRLAFFAVPL